MFESAHKPVQDMHLASLHRDDLLPQAPDDNRRGLLLAFAAHAVLIAAIAFGVSWNSSEPTGAQAELWAAVPQVAAQRATTPEADSPPPPPAPPKPRPEPRVESPPPTKPAPDPQIAIEREKARKDKLREDKLKAEREEERQEKLAREKKERDDKLRNDKKAAEQKVAEQKAAEQKKKQQQLEQARADAVRAEQLRRNQRLLGGERGSPDGSSDRTAGPSVSPGYGSRVREAVYPNIIYSEMQRSAVEGNPTTVIEVRLAPDGTILGSRIKQSSGVPSWDAAVLRALEKTQKLPLDNGKVHSPMDVGFQPRS